VLKIKEFHTKTRKVYRVVSDMWTVTVICCNRMDDAGKIAICKEFDFHFSDCWNMWKDGTAR
jgi:hypothetical protein